VLLVVVVVAPPVDALDDVAPLVPWCPPVPVVSATNASPQPTASVAPMALAIPIRFVVFT
jgi:hypothetical protein